MGKSIKKFLSDGRELAARIIINTAHGNLAKNGKEIESNPHFAECAKKYESELKDWEDPYGYWLSSDSWEKRAGGLSDEEGVIKESFSGKEYSYRLLTTENIVPALGWKTAVKEALERLSGISADPPLIIYGDEDSITDNKRHDPFFKPDFSPELLCEFNYMGDLILVREDVLGDSFPECDPADPEMLYVFLKKQSSHLISGKEKFNVPELCEHLFCGVLHIPHILSHRIDGEIASSYDTGRGTSGMNPSEDLWKNSGDVLSSNSSEFSYKTTCEAICANSENAILETVPTVSVIICSKDHPEVLKVCLSSLREKTDYDKDRLFITVVDNGSEESNKAEVSKLSKEYGFEYIYAPQPFNYSRMNNIGAENAKGDFILLLNDDTEVIDPLWLKKMVKLAKRPHVGAVGAKLLYAGTNKIQHAGVSNLAVGPSHKILAYEDDRDIYFGRNRASYNMLAVTGACLLVSAGKFRKVGGLNEDLKVAYNDIDFCFKLFEKGYMSVQCNSAVLYHYESLTRGMDEGNEEKYNRLLLEKDKLYGLHSWARNFDPFYNPNLIDNSADYLPSSKDCTRDAERFSKRLSDISEVPKDSFMIRSRLDRIQKQLRNTNDSVDFYWMDGWSFVRGCDNRRFERSLILVSEDRLAVRRYELFPTYRKDIAEAFKKESYVSLSGFYFRLPVKDLEGKTWNIGILHTDVITGKQLYKDLQKKINP